jgi:serine/threonine protein kinase
MTCTADQAWTHKVRTCCLSVDREKAQARLFLQLFDILWVVELVDYRMQRFNDRELIMPVTVSSAWEEHSYLRRDPCRCGGEIRFALAQIQQYTAEAVIEQVTGQCDRCGDKREMSFDLTAYFKNADFASMSLEAAWPPSAGSPYPMAEQKLPKFDKASGGLETFSLNGRWHILGRRSGSMGAAYFCVDKEDPLRFAVCKSPLHVSEEEAHLQECHFYQAFSWSTGQRSTHVLDLYDILSTGIGTPVLVLEAVMPGPDQAITVADWLQLGKVTPDLAAAWTAHIATGLLHCRAIVPGFVHADLKPDNLLVDIGWICKLSDFGMSGSHARPAQPGAPLYRAPELWSGAACSAASDVYSLGCIAYEMFCGRPPYIVSGNDTEAMAYAHRSQVPRADDRVPPMVFSCLAKAPEDRPVLEDIIAAFSHPSTRAAMVTSEAVLLEKINHGAALISMGDPALAIEVLRPLTGTGHEGVFANLATALSQLGQYKAADGAYARLAETSSLEANLNYAAHLHRCERFEQALDVSIGAVTVDPRSIAARVVASAVLNDLGRSSEALDHLNQAKLIDPAHPTMLYQLAFTCMELGRYPAAKRMFDKLLRVTGTTDFTRALAARGYEMCPRVFVKPV